MIEGSEGLRIEGTPNIDPKIVGFPGNKDPNKGPLISETPPLSGLRGLGSWGVGVLGCRGTADFLARLWALARRPARSPGNFRSAPIKQSKNPECKQSAPQQARTNPVSKQAAPRPHPDNKERIRVVGSRVGWGLARTGMVRGWGGGKQNTRLTN